MSDVEGKFKSIVSSFLKLIFSSKLGREIEKSALKNILIIRQHDQLGDMLLAVPLLRALREGFPGCSITLIASPVNYQIMRNNPFLDAVLNYDKSILRKSLFASMKFYKTVRSKKYDLAIVPSTISISMTSNLMVRFCGARYRIGPNSLNGIQNPTAFCFTHPVDLNWTTTPRLHHSARNLEILKPLGIHTEDLRSTIGLTRNEEKQGIEFLTEIRKRHKLLVGFHPGAGHPENRWEAQKFASLAGRLVKDYNAGIVVTSGPMDKVPIELVKQHLQCEYLLVENKSIRDVAAIIHNLDLFLANDTGIMHVAGATKVNLLSLFGPSDPLLWAPVGVKNRYIIAKGKTMESLSEEEVWNMIGIILLEMGYKPEKR
ncbi:MAG: glycosyltransferase family 9 protein [Bacteroidota bacterium]